MYYAQLNSSNICVGVSNLSGAVPEYNYATSNDFDPITGQYIAGELVFRSRMIEGPVFTENYIGLHYTNDGKWEKVEEV